MKKAVIFSHAHIILYFTCCQAELILVEYEDM